MTITVGEVIDRARNHDKRFIEERHSNRIALAFLSRRRRSHVKDLVESMKDRFSRARAIASIISGNLVGVDENNVLYQVSTGEDGYAVAEDDNAVLYLVAPVISSDPFSTGFPLPDTSLRLIQLYAELRDTSTYREITVVPQHDIGQRSTSGQSLVATINGWRLIPLKNPTDLDGLWDRVITVTMIWVDEPPWYQVVGNWKTQTLTPLPDTYGDALELELAAYFAGREESENADFSGVARRLERDRDVVVQATRAGAELDHSHMKFRQTKRNR